jgi:hypothetical protein
MLAFVIGAKLMPEVSRPDLNGALAARHPGGALLSGSEWSIRR